MYSAFEKRQSCKYWKFTAASTQNGDFYCKKRSFAKLLLTNPLYYTIRHNIAMELVGIGCLLSLTIWPQRVIIMVISMIFFFSDFGWWILNFKRKHAGTAQNFKISKQKKSRSFLIHHGKHHLSCCYRPCMPFPFISMLFIYSYTSRKTIEKKNHWKRARFDGETAATELDLDMAGRSRDPVKDS